MDKNYMAVGSSMLILKLLEQQDMYGYQIIKELEKRSERVFTLKEGTLYPLLTRLSRRARSSVNREPRKMAAAGNITS